jgi:hypothetical protein
MTDERLNSGYAALATDSTDVPVQVSGVAIGEGDITRGGSGKQTLWPRETLEAAAKGLAGKPLATDENHTTDGTQPQTPSKAVIGEVTWSGYKPGVGVLYEAELDDPDIARSVENGRLEVSPLVSRDIEPLEDGEAEYVATEIQGWRDLATVVNGAAPSNEITVGDNPMKAEALHKAVEALQEDIDLTPPQEVQDHAQAVLDWREDDDKDVQGMTDTGWSRAEQLASGDELSVDDVQEISAWFARHGSEEYDLNEEGMNPWEDNGRVAIKGWGGPPMRSWINGKREQLVEVGDLEAMRVEALKEVAGVEFEDTDTGDLDESEIPNEDYESHYLYPADTKTESSYPVVDADGNLRKGNVDAAWNLGARGGVDAEEHDERLLELAQEFDTPPEWATDDAMSGGTVTDPALWEACSLTLPESLGNEPAESGADEPQSDDGPNEGSAQSSAGASNQGQTMSDELTDSEQAILTAAESVEEPQEALEQFAAAEQPKIVEQNTYEALNNAVNRLDEMMADRLIEDTGLSEKAVEAMSFEAKSAHFETDDGEFDAEALVQSPETGQPEESETEALSEDADTDKAEALYQDMDKFDVDHKDTICEALGVDEWEAAQEVLN